MQRKKRQTILFGCIAAVGLILIGSVVYKVIMEGRVQLYENQRKGFSLEHPVRWAIVENHPEGADVIFVSPKENALDFYQENVNIVIQDLSLNAKMPQKLDEYSRIAMRQIKVVFKSGIEVLEDAPTFLDNRLGHKFVYQGQDAKLGLKLMHIWTIDNGRAYQFTYSALISKFDKFWPQAEKMLDSFKILE